MDSLHHNLISLSQLCDNQMIVKFTKIGCNILGEEMRKVLLIGKRAKNNYIMNKFHFNEHKKDTWKCDWLLGHIIFIINLKKISTPCDKTSTINLAKNPIVNSCLQHIEVKQHFIRDHATKDDIELTFVDT